MNEPTQPLRIVELRAQNVKRLRAVHITPRGSIVGIGGRNGQGKSSVLDSIAMALAGDKCDKPINSEATRGEITIDLGEFLVKRTFTESGGQLTITGKDGKKFASPQTMLDTLIGDIAFDPLEFSRMKPADQLNTLRQLVGVSTAFIDQARQGAFEERTMVNRMLKQAESKEAAAAAIIDGMEEPTGYVSVEGLTADLNHAREVNQTNAQARNAVALLKQSLAGHSAEVNRACNEVESLQRQLNEAIERRNLAREHLTQVETNIAKKEQEIAKLQDADDSEILGKIANCQSINQTKQQFELWRQRRDIVIKAREESEELTAKIEALDAKKREKIANAKYPVKGLQLSDEGVTFNGIPFPQASSAEKLRVSVAMGLAMNPKLRVMLIRDGSLLDDDSLAMIEQMADDAQAQIWVERVGDGEECQVVMEDGGVKEVRP